MKKLLIFLFGIMILVSCTKERNDFSASILNTPKKETSKEIGSTYIYNKNQVKNSAQEYKLENQELVPNKIVYEKDLEKTNIKLVHLYIKKEDNHIELHILNPTNQFIRAARVWLAFPPKSLEIKNLNLNSTIFDLAAPNEYKIDQVNGLIKIGLSSTTGTKEKLIYIGSFDFKNISNDTVPLNCYDYGDNSDSHCAVYGNENVNLLYEVKGVIIDYTKI